MPPLIKTSGGASLAAPAPFQPSLWGRWRGPWAGSCIFLEKRLELKVVLFLLQRET